MRYRSIGPYSVAACLWALALYFNSLALAEQPTDLAMLPPSSPFKSGQCDLSMLQNSTLTPIEISDGSKIRGLSLSGNCHLTKVADSGRAVIGGKSVKWDSAYKMGCGCALLHCKSDTLIQTGPAVAVVKPETTLVAHRDGYSTRFVNLTDKHRYSVRVIFKQRFIDLDPGQELVLVETTGNDARAIAINELIAWKDVQYEHVDNIMAFMYRVSTSDMMDKCKIYRQLSQSSLPEDRLLKNALFKTVAALEVMYNKKTGPFALSEPYKHGAVGPESPVKEAAKSKGSSV